MARQPGNKRDRTASKRSDNPRSYGPTAAEVASGSSRAVWVLLAFALFAVIFALRLVYLQVVVADEYSAQAQETRTANIETSPRRGTIYDRNGNVLATSIDATTIYANPHEVTDVDWEAYQLASVLGGTADDYKKALSSDETTFVYLKRKADVAVADKVRDLDLDGIYFIADTKRVYPYGQIGGQVIGFVGIDGEGLTGLELYYDETLNGTPGTLVVERGAGGIPIPGGVHEETRAVDGEDIIISIDIGMQEYLEQRLTQAVSDMKTETGNSVIMDAGTGEIYACASLPLFDPSNPDSLEDSSGTQAKSITTSLEPGSIFKSVAVMAILENGAMIPETELYCPSYIEADGYVISDAHDRGGQTMTLRQILDNSSNVGISLATETIGFEELYRKITAYEFSQTTGIDYPGEASGYLANQSDWSLVQSYNICFGQGISVSPLQMARFYGSLMNDGVAYTPHFLIEKPLSDDQPVYEETELIKNKEAIPTMTSMLETVVTGGTGIPAQIEGYRVAGKTSTAEIYSESGGYKGGVYNICFTGFLPGSTSQLVCFVGVDEYGGDGSVANVFSDIMSFAIDRYKIAPN